jgi:hypothetical protein
MLATFLSTVAAPAPGQTASILEKIWIALSTGAVLQYGMGAALVVALACFLWYLATKDKEG